MSRRTDISRTVEILSLVNIEVDAPVQKCGEVVPVELQGGMQVEEEKGHQGRALELAKEHIESVAAQQSSLVPQAEVEPLLLQPYADTASAEHLVSYTVNDVPRCQLCLLCMRTRRTSSSFAIRVNAISFS